LAELTGLKIELECTQYANAFGWVVTPEWGCSNLSDDFNRVPGFGLAGVTCIPGVGAILTPTYSKVDTMITDWSLTSTGVAWQQATDSVTGKKSVFMRDSTGGVSFVASIVDALPAGSCGWIRLGRGLCASTDAIDTTIGIGVSDPTIYDGQVPIRLVLQHDQPPTLQYQTASGWSNGAVSRNFARSQDIFTGSRSLWIGWFSFPAQNQIVVSVGGEYLRLNGPNTNSATAGAGGVVTSSGSNIMIAAGSLEVTGTNGTVDFNYFPMAFAAAGSITGATLQLDFVYQQNGNISIPKSVIPTGCSATYTLGGYPGDQTGTQLQYVVSLTGDGTSSPVLPQVDVQIPIVTSNASMIETVIFTEADILSMTEHEWEDQNRAEDPDGGLIGWIIRRQAGIKMNNWLGKWSGIGLGHACVQLSRALTVLQGGVKVQIGPMIPFVTGYTGERTTLERLDPNRTFDIVLENKDWALRRASSKLQRNLDGFCYQAAMRLQLEAAGVNPAFIDTWSDFGYGTCSAEWNPPDCPHFKLSNGTAQAPAFSFQPEAKFCSNMMFIAGQVHEVVWCDSVGVYHRAPYNTLIYQTPFEGTFSTRPVGDMNDPAWLMDVRRLSLSVDTLDMRTEVMTIGVDPATNQMRAGALHVDDQPGYDEFTQNVIGFQDPLIVSSRLFDDPNVQNVVMQAMLSKCMIPGVKLSGIFNFLANDWVYNTCYVAEGTPVGEFGCVLNSTQPFILIERIGEMAWRPDGTQELFSERHLRWWPNATP